MPSTYHTRGWPFPPEFERQGEGVSLLSQEENIAASIHALLGTATGERFLVPDYGCDLKNLFFETINDTGLSEAYVKDVIQNALKLHEKRVTLTDVKMRTQPEEGRVVLDLSLLVRETGREMRMTHEFLTL